MKKVLQWSNIHSRVLSVNDPDFDNILGYTFYQDPFLTALTELTSLPDKKIFVRTNKLQYCQKVPKPLLF